MMMEIEKSTFVPLEGITQLIDSKLLLKNNKKNNNKTEFLLSLDVSYKDSFNHECFKVLELKDEIDFNNVLLSIVKSNVFVVELAGLEVNYTLGINSIENEEVNNKNNEEINNENKEAIKEEIKNEYEKKLTNEMNERNVKIIETKNRGNEFDFLSFFDSSLSNYYKIKTIYNVDEKELNSISKEYNITIEELLKGYDRKNKCVVFKLKG